MKREELQRLAPLLQEHALSHSPHGKPHFIGPNFLSISEAALNTNGFAIADLETLPPSIYDGPDETNQIDSEGEGSFERKHVFLRSGLDRALGAGWRAGAELSMK